MYKSGLFKFTFNINSNYPHEPPKVKCTQTVSCSIHTCMQYITLNQSSTHAPVLFSQIYHPNIDLEGNVCLNILREDWKPVLNLNSVMVGLQYLFLEPNPGDPLNKDAADELRRDRSQFANTVKRTLAGGTVKGVAFDKVTK